MSPQPTASGVGHGAASPVPQSGIEKIHGSDYGLQFEGADCIDPTDGLRGDFWLVMKKIGGEWCALRRFAAKSDCQEYISTQLKAARGRGRR